MGNEGENNRGEDMDLRVGTAAEVPEPLGLKVASPTLVPAIDPGEQSLEISGMARAEALRLTAGEPPIQHDDDGAFEIVDETGADSAFSARPSSPTAERVIVTEAGAPQNGAYQSPGGGSFDAFVWGGSEITDDGDLDTQRGRIYYGLYIPHAENSTERRNLRHARLARIILKSDATNIPLFSSRLTGGSPEIVSIAKMIEILRDSSRLKGHQATQLLASLPSEKKETPKTLFDRVDINAAMLGMSPAAAEFVGKLVDRLCEADKPENLVIEYVDGSRVSIGRALDWLNDGKTISGHLYSTLRTLYQSQLLRFGVVDTTMSGETGYFPEVPLGEAQDSIITVDPDAPDVSGVDIRMALDSELIYDEAFLDQFLEELAIDGFTSLERDAGAQKLHVDIETANGRTQVSVLSVIKYLADRKRLHPAVAANFMLTVVQSVINNRGDDSVVRGQQINTLSDLLAEACFYDPAFPPNPSPRFKSLLSTLIDSSATSVEDLEEEVVTELALDPDGAPFIDVIRSDIEEYDTPVIAALQYEATNNPRAAITSLGTGISGRELNALLYVYGLRIAMLENSPEKEAKLAQLADHVAWSVAGFEEHPDLQANEYEQERILGIVAVGLSDTAEKRFENPPIAVFNTLTRGMPAKEFLETELAKTPIFTRGRVAMLAFLALVGVGTLLWQNRASVNNYLSQAVASATADNKPSSPNIVPPSKGDEDATIIRNDQSQFSADITEAPSPVTVTAKKEPIEQAPVQEKGEPETKNATDPKDATEKAKDSAEAAANEVIKSTFNLTLNRANFPRNYKKMKPEWAKQGYQYIGKSYAENGDIIIEVKDSEGTHYTATVPFRYKAGHIARFATKE